MQRSTCPICGRQVMHSDHEEIIVCDSVKCAHTFTRYRTGQQSAPGAARNSTATASPIRSVPERTASPALPKNPTLLEPHRCSSCQQPIHDSIGDSQRTLTHSCGHRISLYAIQFYTPCCSLYVEVPRSMAGQRLVCPRCQRLMTGPYTDILHQREGDIEPGELMRWNCLSCGQLLQSNVRDRLGQPLAGRPVVCPTCRSWITVPSAGLPVLPSA
ncbi:MAG: hypothetical protein SNJ82_04210 [Gemmataceae bacterium]